MNLAIIQHLFPKTSDNAAVSGVIPIEWFETYRHIIRQVMKKHNLRYYYRGPRVGRSTNTTRNDAYGIVLYKIPVALIKEPKPSLWETFTFLLWHEIFWINLDTVMAYYTIAAHR